MLPGECKGIKPYQRCECKLMMNLSVLQSAAGYYLGFWCNDCGPYSRETEYYATKEEAEHDLKHAPDTRQRI